MPPTLAPPGETTHIRAERVLVVAPHYDDDLIGCGGLLAQLVAAGSAVKVVFVSDGSGGDEVSADRDAYASRRRQEAAEALAVIGVGDLEHLDLPDGSLERHLESIAESTRRLMIGHRPDLMLVPSPLEVTRDHRAVFSAVHRLLAPLRGDDELDAGVRDLQVLVYEVNQPAYPDILVDVSGQLELITEAVSRHASQLGLHDYVATAAGIRRFRTLSLPPTVTAAEGYRRLTVSDFVTHSPSQLVSHLGGVPELHRVVDGPMISVVVRTKDRPQLLGEALASLADGVYRRVEVVLVNDGGGVPAPPPEYPFPVVSVNMPENRGRAAAANAGVAAASGDYVAFLDDDDLAAPEHLATLAGLIAASDVRVAYTDAAVGIYELDGDNGWRLAERRLPYSRDFDPELLLLDNYIPFNTLIIDRSLLADVGPFDPELPFFEDWELLIRLSAIVPFHHLRQVTCEYRHFRGGGHHVFGEHPSRRADFLSVKARVLDRHRERLDPSVLARAVDRLRAEAVSHAEVGAARQRELAGLRQRVTDMGDAHHRLNGEREALVTEHGRLGREHQALREAHERTLAQLEKTLAELERVYAEERSLRAVVDDQSGHLERLYAEVERLNGLVREMETTRAWRVHRWWQRARGRQPG